MGLKEVGQMWIDEHNRRRATSRIEKFFSEWENRDKMPVQELLAIEELVKIYDK